MEVWKTIPGFEFYLVSSWGKVRSIRTKRTLRPCISNGYYSVNLWKENKQKPYKIHRLVAQAFIDNHHGKPMVNHRDLNRLNNHVDNLEWTTHRENIHHRLGRSNYLEYGADDYYILASEASNLPPGWVVLH